MVRQGKILRVFIRLAVIFSFLALCACQPADHAGAVRISQKWSDTSPAVNLKHIFLGEINKRGKPTGFHSRPGGKDPESARIARIMSKANKAGVYTARVEVYDKTDKQWREKFSSMFPDRLSPEEVLQAITHAYKNRDKSKKQPWSGPSGLGFPVQGYVLRDGRINTAFPVYLKN